MPVKAGRDGKTRAAAAPSPVSAGGRHDRTLHLPPDAPRQADYRPRRGWASRGCPGRCETAIARGHYGGTCTGAGRWREGPSSACGAGTASTGTRAAVRRRSRGADQRARPRAPQGRCLGWCCVPSPYRVASLLLRRCWHAQGRRGQRAGRPAGGTPHPSSTGILVHAKHGSERGRSTFTLPSMRSMAPP